MKRIDFQLFKLEGPRWKERLIKSYFYIFQRNWFFLPREKFIPLKNITILIYQGVIFLIEYLKISFYERQREKTLLFKLNYRTKVRWFRYPVSIPVSIAFGFITLYRIFVLIKDYVKMNRYWTFTGKIIENRIYCYSGKGLMIETDQIDR